jgi:hypothetical protein
MTTLTQTREAIYQRWDTNWGVTTDYVFENEDDSSLDEGTSSWARLSVREVGGGQESLGGSGDRKYIRNGIVVIQIFTPTDGSPGMKDAGDLAHTARGIFEGTYFSDLFFNDAQIREGEFQSFDSSSNRGASKWRQTTVTIDFFYEEVK